MAKKVQDALIALLLAGKAILDGFRRDCNHYGIIASSANKAVFYNRLLTYDVTIGKVTSQGYSIPVIAVNDTGEYVEDSTQFDNWYSVLFSPEGEYLRRVTLNYFLAMLTARCSGWQISGVYFVCKALLECKTPLPDKIVVYESKTQHEASKDDFIPMVNALENAVTGNRQRVENDPILSRYYGLVSSTKKRVPATVKPMTGGKTRF